MTRVSIVETPDYSRIKEDIDQVFRLHGGLEKFVARGERVLIKPNLLGKPRRPDEPVATDPRTILALAELLLDRGARVSVGDSPAFHSAGAVLEALGVLEDLRKRDVRIQEFNRPEKRLLGNALDRAVLEADRIINLPRLKVHCQLLFTLGVKNLFGCVSGKRKPYLHMTLGDRENLFAENLVRNCKRIAPAFTLVDGIEAMEGKGPRDGRIKRLGLLVGGPDAVAVDRIILDILGIPPENFRVWHAARDLKIGVWERDQIEILGPRELPRRSIQLSRSLDISFAPHRVLKSTIKGLILKKLKHRRAKTSA